MCYGWRAKIGLITPANGTANEEEFHRYAPEGVSTLTQRILLETVDVTGLSALADRAVEGARILASAGPDLLVFGCTTGSLIKGLGYDRELTDRIQQASGIKTITTSTALVEALKAVNARRLFVTTPYSDAVNAIEEKFLRDSGFDVVSIHGLGYTDPHMMPKTSFAQMYKLTQKFLHPTADTIFVSCTGIGVAGGIKMMETDFRRPVITSNQATLWYALRCLSICEDVGLGTLFHLPHQTDSAASCSMGL